MRVIVVGAGLGGLAAAIAATRAGHEVVVCERAPTLRESGAGIGLMPNGVLALDALGVGERVRAMPMAAPGPTGVRDRHGRLLLASDQAAVTERVGAPVAIVTRRWLHRLLARTLDDGAGDAVRTGVDVLDVGEDGRLRTTTGELRADLVIAADGVGSTVRGRLFPEHPGVEGVGERAARAVVPAPAGFAAADLPAGELLDHRTGRRFGCIPMADGNVYWYATWRGMPDGRPRDWLLAVFADWHPAVAALVAGAEPDGVRVDELVRLARPLPSLVRGRVALLGDAAHAMTPDLGQGGCQAFEDAVTLGRELTGLAADGVPGALRRYDAERRPRTAALLRASNRMNRVLTLTGPGGRVRDVALRAVPARLATAVYVKQLRMAAAGALGSPATAHPRDGASGR